MMIMHVQYYCIEDTLLACVHYDNMHMVDNQKQADPCGMPLTVLLYSMQCWHMCSTEYIQYIAQYHFTVCTVHMNDCDVYFCAAHHSQRDILRAYSNYKYCTECAVP